MSKLENFIGHVRKKVEERAERREAREIEKAEEEAAYRARRQQSYEFYEKLKRERRNLYSDTEEELTSRTQNRPRIGDVEREEFEGRRAEYRKSTNGFR